MLEIGVVGAAALLTLLWWRYAAATRTEGRLPAFSIPAGVTVTSTSLLTEEEIALYNLLRMTVQEQYVVFSQVPLWSFVSVEAMGKARTHVLSHMALKRVDFVLVHPGSREVEQAVLIEPVSPRPHQTERERVIESVLDAAGIKLVKLRANKSYTIPDLAGALGLELGD